jgi:hypothetical protein
MVINNLDVRALSFAPDKADSPLIVYPDAMLTGALAFQRLEAIPGRNAQVVETLCSVEHPQLPTREGLKLARQTARNFAAPDPFSLLVGEAPDHVRIMTLCVI